MDLLATVCQKTKIAELGLRVGSKTTNVSSYSEEYMMCETTVNRAHFQAWVALRICSLKFVLFCPLVMYILLRGRLMIYVMWWFMISFSCVFLISLSQNDHSKLAMAAAAKPRKTPTTIFFERGDWDVTYHVCVSTSTSCPHWVLFSIVMLFHQALFKHLRTWGVSIGDLSCGGSWP